MNKLHLWIIGILSLLWLFLGSFFSNKYCNCGNAAVVPAVVLPAVTDAEGATKSILLTDAEKEFKSGTNDNLLFPLSKCEYIVPISEPLNKVFSDAVAHLKANPQRLLVLTGLHLGSEANECADAKDLGYGRADRVKALLVTMGAPENQVRTQSAEQEVAMFEGNVMGGVSYEFISGDISEVENRLKAGNITLHFETNKQNIALSKEQQQYFEDLKFFLTQKPDAKISVSGHTDNKGNLKYNLRLSRKRAEFVKDYMVQNGIPKKNILAEGIGPNKPIDTNDTDEGKAKNRRVEVKIQ